MTFGADPPADKSHTFFATRQEPLKVRQNGGGHFRPVSLNLCLPCGASPADIELKFLQREQMFHDFTHGLPQRRSRAGKER